MIKIPALVLLTVLPVLTACDQTAGANHPSPELEAVIARCEQAVREKAEFPLSVSFGQILDDYNGVMRDENITYWMVHGAFTQQVEDRFVVPHFYKCTSRDDEIMMLDIFTGHAADYDETASRSMCQQAVAQRSEAPSGAHFRSDMPEAASGTLPSWRVSGTVDLMNASGSFGRHRYSCLVYHGEVFEIELTEED